MRNNNLNYKLKLRVMKKFDVSSNWKRFREVERILIDNNSIIQTEAQLCGYIYNKYGEGRYMVLAWAPKTEGFWCFWLGFLYPNGFIRDINKNKDLINLRDSLKKAESYDEREQIEEEIDFEKEVFSEIKKMTKRGPVGLIKYRPGILHGYNEEP